MEKYSKSGVCICQRVNLDLPLWWFHVFSEHCRLLKSVEAICVTVWDEVRSSCLSLDFTTSHSAIVQRHLCSFSKTYLLFFFFVKARKDHCTNEQRHKCVCDVILECKWQTVCSFKYLASKQRMTVSHQASQRGLYPAAWPRQLASWQLCFFSLCFNLFCNYSYRYYLESVILWIVHGYINEERKNWITFQ